MISFFLLAHKVLLTLHGSGSTQPPGGKSPPAAGLGRVGQGAS